MRVDFTTPDSRTAVRAALLVVVVLSSSVIVASYVNYSTRTQEQKDVRNLVAEQMDRPIEERDRVAPPRDNVTVFTGQAFGSNDGGLIALNTDGKVLYYNNSHDDYFDVDPSPVGRMSVTYIAHDTYGKEHCDMRSWVDRTGEVVPQSDWKNLGCRANHVERVNLSTGEVTRLFTFYGPLDRGNKIHDVDPIDGERVLIGDLGRDRVFVVNTTTNVVEWQWEVRFEGYSFSDGGPYPMDWTHLNDVEMLDNGLVMVSLRNFDEVVFVDPETGKVDEMTLGGNESIVSGQHNPDYIDRENGGPAVIVADSGNNRIVEYQREGGEWNRTWTWQDAELDWPRDADRLPNGHTLITDTGGDRIVEVDENGTVIWEITGNGLYDAERLGTGAESDNGPSASEAGLPSRTVERSATRSESAPPLLTRLRHDVRNAIPDVIVNGVALFVPVWMNLYELLALSLLALSAVTWSGLELRWSPYAVTVRSPIEIERD